MAVIHRMTILPLQNGILGSLGPWLWLGALLALAGPVCAAGDEIQFPGPVAVTIFGAPLSAAGVPWSDGTTDYLVVGDDLGYINLLYHFADNSIFQVLTRSRIGGEVVALETWTDGPAGVRTLVAGTADPDRLLFLEIQYQAPYVTVLDAVDLPEDPGAIAFVEPTDSGEQRLAVSLPGYDALALLQQNAGQWAVQDLLPAGDQPFALAAVDWDDDGRLDILSADRGALSGSVGVYGLDDTGAYALVDHWDLTGDVSAIAGGDFDLNGQDEFLVTYRDDDLGPRLEAYSAVSGAPVLQQVVPLAYSPDRLRTFTLFNDHPAVLTTSQAMGLMEFLEYTGGTWQRREVYYPGGNPIDAVPADLNGDGYHEVNCLAVASSEVNILLGNNGPGYWGFPARPLGTNPLNLVDGDFDGDGDPDLALTGLAPLRLVMLENDPTTGPLATIRSQDLEFLPGFLCAADFLGDGAEELGVVDLQQGGLALLSLDAGGAFTETAFLPLVTVPTRLSAGDIDGDGFQDLLAVLASSRTLHVYFGDGQGGFTDPEVLVLPLGLYDARALAMDGDPFAELVATDDLARVWVVPNLDGRSFGTPVAYQAGSGASFLSLTDLDGDLDADVVVGNTSGETLSLLENVGDGTLLRRVGGLSLDGEPLQLAARDLNGDGLGDFLVTLGGGGGQRLLLSSAPWEYQQAMVLNSSGSIHRAYLGDFDQDQRLDILNLDNALQLGVVLRNTALAFVPVESPLLELSCHGEQWELGIEVPPGADWVLSAEDGNVRRELARNGQAALGTLTAVEDRWVLRLDPSRWWPDPSALIMELRSAGQSVRLVAPEGCGAAALPRLRWQAQPWPNPFNPRVEARIRLTDPSLTRVTIHDVAGRKLATLLDAELPAGVHPVVWDGRSEGRAVAAGVYFLRVSTEQGELSRKIVLVK